MSQSVIMSEDKNQNKFLLKKIFRKQLKSLSILSKHENIDFEECQSTESSQFLLISNAGLTCEVSYEELFDILSVYGKIKDIVLIPQKPYVLIEFNEEFEAKNALNSLNQNICHQLNRQLNVAFISPQIWEKVLKNNKQTIDSYCSSFEDIPNGLILLKNFITAEEENRILDFTNQFFEDIDGKSQMKNRLVKHFGFEFNYLTNKINDKPIEEIPEEYNFILNRLKERKLIEEVSDQLTINYYMPGHGIPNHTDTHSMCENCIISVSIGSDIVMQFRNPEDKRQSNIFVPKKSVLLMTDESRYLWTHSISSSKSDVIVSKDNKNRLSLSQRKTRISLTFRKVKTNQCNCRFHRYCDSRITENSCEISEQNANHLESEYVHKVYESIASHFSETRYKPWPKVTHFLNSLPNGSIVLDVGCGNGKYLNVNPNIFMIGCDRSEGLLTICKQRNCEVFLSDCLQLSVRNSFDGCISIAVLHHLSSHQRRVKALQSIVDLLTINGKALIYVWAFEQNKDGNDSQYLKKSQTIGEKEENEFNLCVHQNGTQFQGQELLVPWKTKNERQLRYYHVFKDGELESLLKCLSNTRVLDIYYDSGNWATILERT